METIDPIDSIIKAQISRRNQALRNQYKLWDRGLASMDMAACLLAEQLGLQATPLEMLRHQAVTAVIEV